MTGAAKSAASELEGIDKATAASILRMYTCLLYTSYVLQLEIVGSAGKAFCKIYFLSLIHIYLGFALYALTIGVASYQYLIPNWKIIFPVLPYPT